MRCSKCNTVHKISLTEEKVNPVKTIISKGKESIRTTLYLTSDYLNKELSIGDRLELDESLIISAIENKNRKRVKRADIKDIGVLWCKVKDSSINITINLGKYTKSFRVKTNPEDVFKIGDVYKIDNLNFIVHAIRAGGSTKRYGQFSAENIERIYGRITPIKATKILDVTEP